MVYMQRLFWIERHALGPRVFVLGCRVHEWQLGVALGSIYLVGVTRGDLPPTSVPGIALALVSGWLVLKDWRDLVPGLRDSAAWRLGIHRPPLPLRPLRRFDSIPALAATVAAVIGCANLVWALSPGGSWLDDLLPRTGPLASTPIFDSLAFPAAMALIVCAFQLRRRNRAAWGLAVGLLTGLGVLKLLQGPNLAEAAIALAPAAVLWWGRGAFCVRASLPRVFVLRLVAALAGGCFALIVASVLAIAHVGLIQAGREGVALVRWDAGPIGLFDEAGALPLAVKVATILVLVSSSYLVFRSSVRPEAPSEGELRTARLLVCRHGADTLAFFKLRRDTQHLFSADRTAFLAYRIEAGVLIVSGDPVGSSSAVPELLRRACSLAETRGLRLAVLGAGPELLPLYRQAGLRPFYMGDEAIVETAPFSLEGRAIRKVRQSVARLERAGYTTELRVLGTLARAELAELERVSQSWRRGQPERGFAMALDALNPDDYGDTIVALARDADRIVRGFLHFVPAYGRAAVSLSAMRREPQTPNGLTEFMVVRAIEALRADGVAEVSLDFAAFARLLHGPGSRRERLLGRIVAVLDPYFQIESLYRFNAKFFPRWQPRYLLYEGRLTFPRTALAALIAEGQLRWRRNTAAA